ncbi:putative bifunctional diguanylate cyclase/phosphodiesterase [Janthinobacterium lividum]|uniref:putative bifunctional diguanylate cyclase/phosphodiesterase n=1 Tax=Janthinobacterium lividum TaxID=29581 RepID=UPI000892B5F4|nr:cyclic di-GMP phosphodiesterase Gmr [Janthinobacterium lividum]WQE31227.1 EAL domain-containing protein [Janthinobacterium lividum]STQ96755.1 Cyclic di-GMP phosphodiesterase Gmr [Janthinobacterium lividum]
MDIPPLAVPDPDSSQHSHDGVLGHAAPLLDDGVFSPERMKAEREQAYFNDLYLLAPVAYFVLGLDGAIVQVNLVAAELFGLVRERLGHVLFRSYVHEAFRHDFEQFVQRVLNSSEPERIQLQVRLRLGAREAGLPVSLLGSADPNGQALRLVLEQAEGKLAALERSEERFRRIVHGAEEGIWEIDAQALTSFVNPKMAHMLGCQIEDMLGQPLAAFMDDEGRAILERNIARRQDGIAERHEFKFLRRDGSTLWATLATNPIFDSSGTYLGALALVSDITAQRAASERIWRQANFDPLTGLPNRHMFLDRLQHEARHASREGGCLALLFIDLDHFKQVNDRLGHEKGDMLLRQAALRISERVRATDTVARLGGDEFTVILAGVGQLGGIERVLQELTTALALPFVLDGDTAQVSASVGVALYPADAEATETLLRHADQAMYAAKSAGRNGYSYFTPALQQAADLRRATVREMRLALAQEQFEVHYQPIIRLCDGAIERAEALLRWRHPLRGLLVPADFIAFAEANGLIIDIGEWVFQQVVRQARQWQGEHGGPFPICINKSPAEFRCDAALYQDWGNALARAGLAPDAIVIETTEAVLLDKARQVGDRLRQFRAMGLALALDDFGSGQVSLGCIKKADIDFLKIDRSLVGELGRDDAGLGLCEAIIALAQRLGVKVVAEGVETASQRDLLRAAGCDYAQGYFFSRALLAGQMDGLLAAQPAA